jgi:threonine synthase
LTTSPHTPHPSTADVGWNPTAQLRCMQCGRTTPVGPQYAGCTVCATQNGHPPQSAPLEVVYDDAGPSTTTPADVTTWLTAHRQPIGRGSRVALGRPRDTPLVPVATFGRGVYVKNETLNPTWGHKDRLHEVGVGAAMLLGARGVLATSTGNHGAAAAAHAAAAGLPSLVFCHEHASSTALLMIAAYGGVVAQLPAEQSRETVMRLVDDGWFPATSMDPDVAGRSNPYGAEGYKEIAYEIVRELGRMPQAVVVPTASGDTLYGVAKGFAEISELAQLPLPLIVAGQPATADALVRSHHAGRRIEVANASSFALSVADPVSGRQAMAALNRWNGEATSVTEHAIRAATRDFAHVGLLVEPASAVSLATYRALLGAERLHPKDTVVLLATSSGAKWPRELAELNPSPSISEPSQLAAAVSAALNPR